MKRRAPLDILISWVLSLPRGESILLSVLRVIGLPPTKIGHSIVFFTRRSTYMIALWPPGYKGEGLKR